MSFGAPMALAVTPEDHAGIRRTSEATGLRCQKRNQAAHVASSLNVGDLLHVAGDHVGQIGLKEPLTSSRCRTANSVWEAPTH
jgi:hypothetical protein